MASTEKEHPVPGVAGFQHEAGRPFRPHGRVDVWSDGALVHVDAEGPFNTEAVERFSQSVIALYRQLAPGLRFVNVTRFQRSMMATPETWEQLAGHLQRVNRSGLPLVATAWVAGPDVEGRGLFVPRGEALFRENGRVFAAFDTLAEAEAWAQEKLAH